MAPDMADSIETVTLGEVYRAVLRVEQIALKTNGRVDKHDTDIALLGLRLDGVAKASAGPTMHLEPTERPDDGSKVSTKAVAGGLVAVGTIGGVAVQGVVWLAKWWLAK